MNPVESFPSFPEFANAGTKQAPEGAKYAAGFLPSETFPSEYANYFFNGATKGVTKLNSAVASIWNELNNILTAYNISADSTQASQLLSVLNKIYPQICECSTAAATQNKSVALNGNVLKAGNVYVIAMTYGNTYGNGSTNYPTLSFNSGTAYPLCDTNGAYLKSGSWNAGDQIKVLFDGTKFLMSTGGVVDFLQSGLLKPVSSGAVYTALNNVNSILICSNAISAAKTVVFPTGYNIVSNSMCKILFTNGHNCADANTHMTLNNIAVVVNKNGVLTPLPIHRMTENSTTVFKSLQPNTVLEMYYTTDYDNNGTPAWVIAGNPVVLSGTDYTVYANGKVGEDVIGTIKETVENNVPYGWVQCTGIRINKADYSELWAWAQEKDFVGTGKLFKDIDDDRFAMPDFRNHTLMGANFVDGGAYSPGNKSNIGERQTAQLPNIKGNVQNFNGTFGVFGFDASLSTINGAFSGSNFSGAHRSGEGSASGAKGFWMNVEKGGTNASTDHLGNNVYYGDFDNETVADRTFGETRAQNWRVLYIMKAK